jgi:hypothetical protein
VQFVGAALGGRIHDAGRGAAEFRREIAGQDAEFLNGIQQACPN